MALGNSNNRNGSRIAGEQTANQHTSSNDADSALDAGATERINFEIDNTNALTLNQSQTQGAQTFRFIAATSAPTAECTVTMHGTPRGQFTVINGLNTHPIKIQISGQSAAIPRLLPQQRLMLNHDGVDVFEILYRSSIYIPASQMVARTTSGAATGTVETTTNNVMFSTLDFDTAADEFAQFSLMMPKGWDAGDVTFQPVWSHASTATNFGVAWFLQGVAFADGDAGDAAFGTAVGVVDTGGTTDDIYIGAESNDITLAGTPAGEQWAVFQIYRDVSDAGDNLGIDARLHGVNLNYTRVSVTDN